MLSFQLPRWNAEIENKLEYVHRNSADGKCHSKWQKKIASSFMVDCSMVVPIYGKYHAWKLYNVEQKVDNKFNKTIRF